MIQETHSTLTQSVNMNSNICGAPINLNFIIYQLCVYMFVWSACVCLCVCER